MPEWLYEAGIGEARAALVDGDQIVEAAIERDEGLRVGTILPARKTASDRATLDDGTDLQLTTPTRGVTQGAMLTVEITREAIPERGRTKAPRATPTHAAPRPAPTLLDRITATGHPVRVCLAHQSDALEAAGWSELLDEAVSGDIVFSRGALRLSPTPAMTLFDVDGDAPLDTLAIAAAHAVALAIRRHGIGGSIGIDFPTIVGKAPRLAVAQAIDETLSQPFERTAVNGFGFLQIVRPRPRLSIPEHLRADPVAATALAALRTLERTPPGTPRTLKLSPAVLAYFDARPTWLAELARRTGVTPRLESE
ncbi:MAG: ribonuclease [Sphingomonas bacterium]|nr:ribonuclease [Sphingomonas bacterium]